MPQGCKERKVAEMRSPVSALVCRPPEDIGMSLPSWRRVLLGKHARKLWVGAVSGPARRPLLISSAGCVFQQSAFLLPSFLSRSKGTATQTEACLPGLPQHNSSPLSFMFRRTDHTNLSARAPSINNTPPNYTSDSTSTKQHGV
jgi:hypothetical protein